MLCEIWPGMQVIDVDGKLVGTVKQVEPPPGQIRVTGAGLMDNDCQVRVDQIAWADDERILLSVAADNLQIESGRWI